MVGATGCYKCGRSDHWSRDCPSSESTPASQQQQTQTQTQTQQRFGGNNKRKEPWVERSAAKPAPAPHWRMPKLTSDVLLGPDGLGYVLEKIPRQVTIRGRGHEVEDLKSLLGAYVMWHQTLLPYFSYSQFVEKLEKVGSTKRIRMCVRDLRAKIERGEDPIRDFHPSTDDAPDTRWDEHYVSDASEEDEHEDDPPADVVEAHLRETEASTPPSSSKPILVIGDKVVSVSQQEEIKDEQRARMEANKQKALERARARKLELENSVGA